MAENLAKRRFRQRIVLVPAPFQGHVTPMMQLATILHMKGFSITVAQTQFNFSSLLENYPDFHFLPIPDSLEESELKILGLVSFVLKLNDVCEASFKESLLKFLQQQKNPGDQISSIVYDEYMYFSETAAKHLNIRSLVFRTVNATAVVSRSVLLKLKQTRSLTLLTESQDKLVPGLSPLKFKDLPTSAFGSLTNLWGVYGDINKKRAHSAVILNTAVCIESSSLSLLRQECLTPIYAIGPLHRMASMTSTGILEEDTGCLERLNKQKPSSVLYISLGSLALMKKREALEMACGFASSNQPFLWVIRPGSIPESEWVEALPEELKGRVSKRGYIVKWAPQKEVLAHKAVGGFWSHCGWNSTLESISNGIPMVCRPFSGDQKVNARYLSHVWRIGIQIEGELERGDIRRAVRRLMAEQEGEEMRKRATSLKEKVEASAREGGPSNKSLDELVDLIRSF